MRVRIRPMIFGLQHLYRVETKSGWFWFDVWTYEGLFETYEKAEEAALFLKQAPKEIE